MAREPFNPNLIEVPPDETPTRKTDGPLTVSQVTALVKEAIESSLPRTVHVVGEISNFKRHSSGHLYFTLKDRSSELSCVMWRSAAAKLKFDATDGLEVVATGGVELFERAGRYQLYVRKIEPRGVGTLELAFRQLCEKLQREGLFEQEHKKPLPPYPQRIALVTSPTSAAVGDMVRTLTRRFPAVHILVYPVRVQGDGAAKEIAQAIRQINDKSTTLGGVDLIIVGRGGGSLEDLWAFNEEETARAIFASRIPIISAVGHEVDVTIADLVADVRAATPTAAAELAVPVLDDVLEQLDALVGRLERTATSRLALQASRLNGVTKRRLFLDPLHVVHHREQLIDEWDRRIHNRLLERLNRSRGTVDRIEPIIQRIAPHAFLLRRASAIHNAEHRLQAAMQQRLATLERRLTNTERTVERRSPDQLVLMAGNRIARVSDRLHSEMRHGLRRRQQQIEQRRDLLEALSYRSVLGRGFSITRTRKSKKVVRSVKQVRDHQRIVTETADGAFESQVINLKQMELFD